MLPKQAKTPVPQHLVNGLLRLWNRPSACELTFSAPSESLLYCGVNLAVSMRRFALLPLLFCIAGFAAPPPVRVWQDKISLPTYSEGAPDVAPPFSVLNQNGWDVYPYTHRANLGAQPADQTWRALNIENEYLSCRVLPDLGGHVYSCRDKRDGHEMFYANSVVKKEASVGLRGAWVAMGIESNFPIGHSLVGSSPVDFALSSGKDGSGTITVEDADRITGMKWRVDYTLRPGTAMLEQRVVLANPTRARHRYSWWSNAAIALDDPAMRFIYPTHFMYLHTKEGTTSWPIDDKGVDLSIASNHADAEGYFAQGCREPFFAVYKPRSRTAVVHYADPKIVTGKKLWLWGSKLDPWALQNLTKGAVSYIEMQAGLFTQQTDFEFLDPGESRAFTEYWLSVRDAGGVARANLDAAVNLERRKSSNGEQLVVEIAPVRAIGGAKVRLLSNGQPVFEHAVDLDPARTFSQSVDAPNHAPYTVQLLDARGALLLEHTENRYDADSVPAVRAAGMPTGPETSQMLLDRGNMNEKLGQLPIARRSFEAALKKAPNSLPVLLAAGRLEFTLHHYDEAVDHLRQVVQREPGNDEGLYYYGAAKAALGCNEEARVALVAVRARSKFGRAAAAELACLKARSGDVAGALKIMQPLLADGSAREGAIDVALLRTSGQTERARASVQKWLAADPADNTVREANVELGGNDPSLAEHLGADPERILDVADLYLNLGSYDSALAVLARDYPAAPAGEHEPGWMPAEQNALLRYYRAWCQRKLGRNAPPVRADAADARFVFPWRATSQPVLGDAAAHDSGDGLAHYLLGLWDLDWQFAAPAIRELETARDLHVNAAALEPTLSAALHTFGKDLPAKAAPVKAASAKAAPVRPVAVVVPRHEEPTTAGSSPVAIANSAMVFAAAGRADEAAGRFHAQEFAGDKQPDDVRRAWIEVQLQRLLAEARAGQCGPAKDGLFHLGDEDPAVAFSFFGFGAFMKAPHFQYLMAQVESSCGDEKAAQKRLSHVAKASAAIDSPDYVYPMLAALRVNTGDAAGRVSGALEEVRKALVNAPASSRDLLSFDEAELLRASGQGDEALKRLTTLASAAKAPMVRYLAATAIRGG